MSLAGLNDELSQVRTKKREFFGRDRVHRSMGGVDQPHTAALLQRRVRQ